MRFKKLTIHNIASIEDATIDFADGVLANKDLFLICGPTGSGKTTILDAICLALFDTTPRIEKSAKELINDFDLDNTTEDNNVKDVMHLMRKNSTDARVVLTFEDRDARECEAVWEVRRKIRSSKNQKDAKRYEEESLEERLKRDRVKEWRFTDPEGNVHTKNVAKRIQEVIKMDFDQFSKTTMLAQGDFTRFLSCSSDEKAQILERLVGTEIYTKVGKVINERARNKRAEREQFKKSLNDIVFLSDAEKVETRCRIDDLDAANKEVAAAETDVLSKLKWIEEREKAGKEVAKAEADLAKATQEMESEEAKCEQHTVNLWDRTEDVRKALDTARRCGHATVENERRRQALQQTYDTSLAGLRHLHAAANRLATQQRQLQEQLDAKNRFAEMYAHASEICTLHANILKNRRTIAEEQPRLEPLEKKRQEALDDMQRIEQQRTDAEQEIARLEAGKKQLRESLKSAGAETIAEEQKALSKRKELLAETRLAMRRHDEAMEDFKRETRKLEQETQHHSQYAAEEKELASSLEVAQKRLEESMARYEKVKESVSEHAKMMRASLQPGDMCPVCGIQVKEHLSDAGFDAAFKPLHEENETNRLAVEDLMKQHHNAATKTGVAANTKKKAEEDVKRSAERRDKALSELLTRLYVLGIGDGDDANMRLEQCAAELAEAEERLTHRQSDIAALNNSLKDTDKEIDKVREKTLKPLDAALKARQKEAEKAGSDMANIKGRISNACKSIEDTEAALQPMLNPDWTPEGDADYFQELKQEADRYTDMRKKLDECTAGIRKSAEEIEMIRGWQEETEKCFPEWKSDECTEAREIANLGNLWSHLMGDAKQLAAAMQENAEALKNAENAAEEFFRAHPEVDLDEVRALLDVHHETVAQMRSRGNSLSTAHSVAVSQYQKALEQLKALAESPLSEGETEESLKKQRDALTAQLKKNSEEKGTLAAKLEADDDKRRLYGEKQAELDKLTEEATEWDWLNNYLGGNASGKNFRNIAQSFVLEELLDRANEYLRNISGRYKLYCTPGSLTVTVRDSYEGSGIRPVNTLSGGESFFVSLALALGLSSLQNMDFEVDTLFIDEGFGSLSQEYLDPVIVSLKRLHEVYGRRVGIISHIETLKGHISTVIEVKKSGRTSSRIEVKTI